MTDELNTHSPTEDIVTDLPSLWPYNGVASERLQDKSAIGRLSEDGILLLSEIEYIFCNKHRNIPLPDEEWLDSMLEINPSILPSYAVFEAVRISGNKVILDFNLSLYDVESEDETWGCRWSSSSHPRNSEPKSEIRWFRSDDTFDSESLINWTKRVSERGRIAEVVVVDDEFSVVTYCLEISDPRGNIPNHDIISKLTSMNKGLEMEGGRFYPLEKWNISQIGLSLENGVFVDQTTCDLIDGKNTEEVQILSDILNRGLSPRPGFKYGTKWRCYDKPIGEDHAPYLIITPKNKPKNWAEACLASRLASGVNKIWILPVKQEKWSYLAVKRPPADSRWTNPNRY